MLQDVKDLTTPGVVKGLNTQYNLLTVQKDQSPNMMDVKVNYDGSIEKRLGSRIQNSSTITGGSSATAGFNPTTSSILTSFEAYWNLDEASGDRADKVGTATLQQYGGVLYSSGKKNQCALFEASCSQYLKAASSQAFTDNPTFSYSAWFYLNSTGGTVNRTILAKRGNPTSTSLTVPFRPSDIATGLVGYWKFNNDATDSSGNTLTLTENGSPTYSANANYWKDEYAAVLAGGKSFSRADGDASLELVGSAYSLSIWMKNTDPLAASQTLFSKLEGGNKGYKVQVLADGSVKAFQGATTFTTATGLIVQGKHQIITVTYDKSTHRIYVDGNLVLSTAHTTDVEAMSADLFVGAGSVAGESIVGNIKDAAIWSVALTPLQVKSLALGIDLSQYAYRPNNVSTQPTHWWKLNEVSGDRADSVSTNPLTMTDVNTVTSSGGYVEGISANFPGGASKYLQAADSADWDYGTGDYSIRFRILADSLANGYFYSRGTNNHGIRVSGGDVTMLVGGSSVLAWTHDLVTGVWYDLCFRRSGTSLKLFVDGVEKASATNSSDISYSDALFIGDMGGSDYFDGRIEDYAIWKGYALTDAEIKSLACGLPIQRQGIVLYSKMNATSGNETSEIGGYTLTDSNVGTAAGQVGTSRDFVAATPSYFSITRDANIDLTADASILGWVYSGGNGYILEKDADGNGYALLRNGNQQLEMIWSGATRNSASTSLVLTADTWVHYSAIYDQAAAKLSINGVQITSDACSTNNADAAENLYLGTKNDGSTTPWDGRMDEFVIAQRYFRPEEIKAVYIKGLNGKEVTSSEVSTGGVGGFEYSLYVGTDNLVTFDVSSSGTAVNGSVSASSFGAVTTATWYNAICFYDSAAAQIGIVVNESYPVIKSYTAGVLAGSALLTLGVENTAHYMDGRIDEVGFWTKRIGSDGIAILYNKGSGNTYGSTVDTTPWASFDFGASGTRWLTCAAGTGIYASSNLGLTWVNIATSRSATYQYLDRSKNVLIATSDAYDAPLYWAGSGSTYMAQVGTSANLPPYCKYSINFQGFLILLNSNTRKRSFNYIDENFQLSSTAWLNFDLPSSADDEITACFILRRYLYVSTKYKIYRVSYVGGNPDWQYVEVKSWGFIPRTVKKIVISNQPQGGQQASYSIGEVVVGLTWDRKIRIFDGSGDQILSNNVEKDNGICDFALDKISYVGSGPVISFAELDPIPNVYKLCVAIGQDSQQTTHLLNYDGRCQALYPYSNMPFNTMCVAESGNRQYLMAFDRQGYCHMMDSGNLDGGTTPVNEVFESPLMFDKTPSQVSKGHKTDLFFTNQTCGTLYYEERTDFGDEFKLRRKFAVGGSTHKLVHFESVDAPSAYNTYQFRLSSSGSTTTPWRLQRYDHFTKGLGIGRNE